MKIIQVLNHFFPDKTAGTEVYVWALCKELQKQAVEPVIVIPNYGKTTAHEYSYDGLTVIQYAEPSIVDRALNTGLREPEGLKSFISLLKQEKPDIVHFHEYASSNAITLKHVQAAKNLGLKIILTLHVANYSCKTGLLYFKEQIQCDGVINLNKCSLCYLHNKGYSYTQYFINFLATIFYKIRYNTKKWNNRIGTACSTRFQIDDLKNNLKKIEMCCDKVVTVAAWYRKVLILNGVPSEKIFFIPQGLPCGNSEINNVNERVAPYRLRLIFLGRIEEAKGLHLLVNALLDIDERLIQLDIFGQSVSDVYELNLRKITKNKSNINWKGLVRQADVLGTLKKYSMLCLCSTVCEMSPLVIQEAFAAGIPVLASDSYGNSEQIRHEFNGLLFKFKDESSLYDQLERCLSEPGLLEKLTNNISAPREFYNVANEYIQLYQKLFEEEY